MRQKSLSLGDALNVDNVRSSKESQHQLSVEVGVLKKHKVNLKRGDFLFFQLP